jgi:hypothetical protein
LHDEEGQGKNKGLLVRKKKRGVNETPTLLPKKAIMSALIASIPENRSYEDRVR